MNDPEDAFAEWMKWFLSYGAEMDYKIFNKDLLLLTLFP